MNLEELSCLLIEATEQRRELDPELELLQAVQLYVLKRGLKLKKLNSMV
jgi:hypothetical protein